ncbi:MAG: hypothetical protein NTU80_02925, partial [Verrucomicrobia bacterium]|nr:hypothetical protein [Verrucomicrobiota bacterium]
MSRGLPSRSVTSSAFVLEALEGRLLLSATALDQTLLAPATGALVANSTVELASVGHAAAVAVPVVNDSDSLFADLPEVAPPVVESTAPAVELSAVEAPVVVATAPAPGVQNPADSPVSPLPTGTVPERLIITSNPSQGPPVKRILTPDTLNSDLLTVEAQQRLNGVGVYDLSLVNHGTFAPGNSPGTTSVTGTFTNASDATLEIELGGTTAGSQYDQVVATGTATLSGTLKVFLYDGFAPTVGQTFTILTSAGITGDFADFAGLNIGNDLYLRPSIVGNNYVLTVVAGPARPLVFVPGFGGSFPTAAAFGEWLTTRGLAPDKLTLEPIENTYGSIIKTLENVGYVIGQNLFIANWDWRLAVAPKDGANDGVVTLTGSNGGAVALADTTFATGIDYLGYAMKQAVETWATNHSGAAPAEVDMLTHSTGGLVARAYIQSTAYNQTYTTSGTSYDLPEVKNLMQIGVPSQGVVQAYNFLADNFGLSSASRLAGLVANLAFDAVKSGSTITGPDGNITLASIQTAGQPDAAKFLRAYFPSLIDLTGTFDFLDTNSTNAVSYVDVNSSPTTSLLLDLNDGLGLDGATGIDANTFIDRLTGELSIIYSSDLSSPSSLQAYTGGVGSIVGMASPTGRLPGASEIWYQQEFTATGDGTVLATSAWGQFDTEANAGRIAKLNEVEITGGTASTSGHSALTFNTTALTHVLTQLGFTSFTSVLDTNEAHGTARQAEALLHYAVGFLLADVRTLEDAYDLFTTSLDAIDGIINAVSSADYTAGFDLPTAAFTLPNVTLDNVLFLGTPVIALSAGTLANPRYQSGTLDAKITFAVGSASLFPGGTVFSSVSDGSDGDANGLVGTYNFATGLFAFTLDQFILNVGSAFGLSATAVTAALNPASSAENAFSFSVTGGRFTLGAGMIAQGDFSFYKGNDSLVHAAASSVAAFVGTGFGTGTPVGLSIATGLFGLQLNPSTSKYALAVQGAVSTSGLSSLGLSLSGTFNLLVSNYATDQTFTVGVGGSATSVTVGANSLYLRGSATLNLGSGSAYVSGIFDFAQDTSLITASAASVTAFFGNGYATPAATGLSLTSGKIAYRINSATLDYALGVEGTAAIIGIAGLSVTGTFRLLSSTFDTDQLLSSTLGGTTYSFNAPADTLFVTGSVDLNISGFAVLRGAFTFNRTATTITAAGTDLTVFMGTGFGTGSATGLQITGGLFALRLDLPTGKFVAGASGSASLVGVPNVTFSATGFTFIANQFDTDQALVVGVPGNTVNLTATALSYYMSGTAALALDGAVFVSADFTFASAPAVVDWVQGLIAADTSVVELVPASAGQPEEQLLTLTAAALAYGTFTLTYDGQTTVALALALNDTATMAVAIQTALRNLSNLADNEVTVTYAGKPASNDYAFRIRFAGALAATNVNQITVAVSTSGTLQSQVWDVALGSATGTFSFTLGSASTSLTLVGTENAATVEAALKAALGTLSPLTPAALTVASQGSGTYRVTVGGDLAGQAIGTLAVSTSLPAATTSVVRTTPGSTAQNEVVALYLNDPSGTAAGTYTLSYNGQTSGTLRFADSMVDMNRQRIEDALEAFTGIGPNNVTVTFDSASTIRRQRYVITFKGALAGQNVSALTANDTLFRGGSVELVTVTQGSAAASETQTVSITSAVAATFTLSLTRSGTTYTTSALSTSANAAAVQAALNTALGSAGTTTVTSSSVGIWIVGFGGALTGTSPPLLVITPTLTAANASVSIITTGGTQSASGSAFTAATSTSLSGNTAGGSIQEVTVTADVAGGTMTLSLTHSGFTYTTAAISTAATAAVVQSALATALSGLAGATATVTSASTGVYRVAFGGTLAGVSVALLEVSATLPAPPAAQTEILIAATNVTALVGNGYQTVTVVASAADTFTLSFVYGGTTYTTAAIATGATATTVQTALTTSLGVLSGATVAVTSPSAGVYRVYLGGVLAATTAPLITATPALGTTTITVTAATSGVSLTGGTLALVLYPDTDKYAFAARGTATVTGLAGVNLSGTVTVITGNLATDTTLEISTPGGTVVADIAAGVTQVYGNLTFDFGGFVAGSGNFTFTHSADLLTVEADSVTAFVGTAFGTPGETGIKVTAAALALKLDLASGLYAFAARGTGSLVGIGSVTLTGTLAVESSTYATSTSLTVGGTTLTLASATSRVTGTALTFDFAGFVAGSGDFVATKTVAQLDFAASNLTAFVGNGYGTASPAGLRLTSADLGLRVFLSTSRYALAARGTGELQGITGLTLAGSLTVLTGTSLTDQILTFAGSPTTVTAGTSAVSGTGITLSVGTSLLLAGDFAFTKSATELNLAATGITAFAGQHYNNSGGTETGVKVTAAVLALRVDLTTGRYALGARGTAAIVGITDFALSGNLTVIASTYTTDLAFTVPVGGTDLTLTAVANSLAFTGNLTLTVADFVALSGNLTFYKDDTQLILAATSVTAFVGTGSTGLTVSNGLIALLYDFTSGDYALGASGTAALTGVSGLTLTGTLEVVVTTFATNVELEVGVGDDIVALTATAGVTTVRGSATVNLAGFVAIEGTFAVTKTATTLAVTATSVTSFLGTGFGASAAVGASLTVGNLGLLLSTSGLTTGQYALAATGTAALVGVPGLALTGNIDVRRSTFATSQNVTLNSVSTAVAANARTFEGTGLTLAIASQVSLSGNLAFDLSTSDVVVLGTSLTASLTLGTFSAGFSSGTLALLVRGNGTFAVSATASTLSLSGAGFASATATAVTFAYNNTGIDLVAAPRVLTIGSAGASLDSALGTTASPYIALAATGVSVQLAGLVTATGNFTFSRATTADGDAVVRIAVANFGATLGTASTTFLTLSNGSGALLVSTAAGVTSTAATLTVSAALANVPGVTLGASTFTLEFNTGTAAVNETFTVGASTVALDLPGGVFVRVIADPIDLTIAGTTLTGRIAFEQTRDSLNAKTTVLSFADVTIAAFSNGQTAAPISIINARGIAVLTSAGIGASLSFLASAGITGISASSEVVLEINNTNAAVDAEGPFGALHLSAGIYQSIVLNNLSIVLPGVEISGDFSFRTVTIGGSSTQIIVGNNVTVFVGNNSGGARIGLELADGQAVLIRAGAPGSITELGFVTGRVRLVGVPGFTVDATMTLRLNETAATYAASFTLDGETVNLDFAADEVASGGVAYAQATATAVDLNLNGFVVLRGDFTFTRTASTFVAAGANITAFAGSGFGSASETGIKITAARFALRIDLATGKFVVGAQGTGSLVGVPNSTLTATLTVIVNQFAATQNLTAGLSGNTVALTAAASTTAISGNGTLNLAGSVVVAADFTFQSSPAIADWIDGLSQGLTTSVTEVVPPASGIDEEQLLTLTSVAQAYGTFTLTYAGQTTASIALALNDPTAMALAIQTALRNLSNLGDSDVTVAYAGSPATGQNSFRVRFTGTLAATNVAPLTVAVSTSGTVESHVWRVSLGASIGTFTFQLGGSGPTSALTLTGTEAPGTVAASLRATLATLSPLTAAALTVTSLGGGDYRVAVGGALTGTVLGALSVATSLPTPTSSVTASTSGNTGVNEIVVITLNDPSLAATGTYTLSLGGKTSAPIRFADNQVEMNRDRIKAALEAFSAIGTGNVSVVFDSNPNPITAQRYIVTFQGARARQNIGDITADFSKFRSGSVTVSTSTQGSGPANTTQTVTVASAVAATFTLSLTLGGTTYTSSALATSASAAQVQAALNAALGSAGSTTVTSSGSGIWTLAFGGALAGTSPPALVVTPTVTAPSASVTVLTTGGTQTPSTSALTAAITTERQGGIAGGSVQEIAFTSDASAPGTFTLSLVYDNRTYTTASLALDASASAVAAALTAAFGTLPGATVSVTSAAAGQYRIAFGGTFAGVALNLLKVTAELTPPPVTLQQILIGATNVTAFLGTNYNNVGGTETGIKLTTGTLAMVLYPTTDEYALAARGTATLVGIPGITFSSTLTLITGNLPTDTTLSIPVGLGTVTAEIPSGITQVYGDLTLDLGGFASVSGSFTFQKTATDLVLAATDVTAFVGTHFNNVGGTETGAKLTNGNLAVLVSLETATLGRYAFGASGTAALVGIPNVTATGTFEVIRSTFASGTDTTLSVEVGSSTLTLTAAGATSQVTGTDLVLNLGGFVAATGNFTFLKTSTDLDVTATSVTAFVGTGYNTPAATGLQVTSGSLALTVLLADGTYAVAAQGTAALVGVPSVTLTGTLTIQTGTYATDVTFTDFGGVTGTDLTVTTGTTNVTGTDLVLAFADNLLLSGDFTFTKSATELSLDASNVIAFAGTGYDTASEIGVKVTAAALSLRLELATGRYAAAARGTVALTGIANVSASGTVIVVTSTQAADRIFTLSSTSVTATAGATFISGTGLTLNLANFVTVTGNLTLFKDDSELIVAATDVTAFIGASGTGLSLTDGLIALIYDFTTAKYAFGASGTASLTGVSGVTLTGTLEVIVSTFASDLELEVGVGEDIVSLTATAGVTLARSTATLDLAGFVAATGSFTATKTADTLTLTATGLTAFLGTGFNTGSEKGVKLTAGSLALTLDLATSDYALAAQGTAAVVGFSALSLSGTLAVQRNTFATAKTLSLAGIDTTLAA